MDQAYLDAYQEAIDEGMEGVAAEEYAEVVSQLARGKDPFGGDRELLARWQETCRKRNLRGWAPTTT